MEVRAVLRNVPMSAQKVREVVRQIQGLPALQARAILAAVPRKSARFVEKTLASAIANAENLRTEWEVNKIRQTVQSLQAQVQNTRNRKRRVALARRLAKLESYLESATRLAPEKLWIKQAHACTAISYKRFIPKARGQAGPILKRHCHIKIVLSDE
ncbi:MAG: 50S ribosomal protein L22 [Verrucomicrobiae bacterium]|nr:50S ribosomal protein L22 [Verrucomicrobiae bacterium]MCX7722112.1 50S ribosomal protein L22 [Verrucomicrobiae bacterium]